MTDWNSFLRSDEFREYRRRQVEAVSKSISKTVEQVARNGKPSLEAMNGRLEMMSVFLRLPETLTQDESLLNVLRTQLDEDVGNITKMLMREKLKDDGMV